MAQIHVEDIQEAAKSGKHVYGLYGVDMKASPEVLQKWIDNLRAAALANRQQCKTNRPWSIVDFSKRLPADQPWIGFEYETGFDAKEDYEKAITFLWDNQRNNAIDREGSGKFPFEVAFPPQSALDFQKGVSNFQGYHNFMRDNGLKQANNPTTYTKRGIGMHVNISTPKSRKQGIRNGATLCEWLQSLGKAKETELFGRYQRHWSLAQNRGTWIEFKCFLSTDNREAVDRYVQIALKFCELIDYQIDGGKKPTNLYEFLSGKDDQLKG